MCLKFYTQSVPQLPVVRVTCTSSFSESNIIVLDWGCLQVCVCVCVCVCISKALQVRTCISIVVCKPWIRLNRGCPQLSKVVYKTAHCIYIHCDTLKLEIRLHALPVGEHTIWYRSNFYAHLIGSCVLNYCKR